MRHEAEQRQVFKTEAREVFKTEIQSWVRINHVNDASNKQ